MRKILMHRAEIESGRQSFASLKHRDDITGRLMVPK